jgi:hypothetical protein
MGYSSSGDIVSVNGGNTYLTVTGGTCATDCLIEVDPSTGAFAYDWGQTGYKGVFGLAFWGGSVYGFDVEGDLFQVTFSGIQMNVQKIPIADAPSGLSFAGAGSTTSAPLVGTM